MLVILAVPAVLTYVFTLPEAVRRSYTFAYLDPTVPTAFTAHFIHLTFEHLAINLLSYGLLCLSCYVLCILAGARRFFYTAFVTLVFVFPFALSGLNLAVPRDAIGYGFSGINMAFFGLLPIALTNYLITNVTPGFRARDAPVFFFFITAMSVTLVLPMNIWSIVIAGGIFLVFVSFIFSIRRSTGGSVMALLRVLLAPELRAHIALVTLLLLVGYPFVAFPRAVVTGPVVINVYIHVVGFCLAFVTSYLFNSIVPVDTENKTKSE